MTSARGRGWLLAAVVGASSVVACRGAGAEAKKEPGGAAAAAAIDVSVFVVMPRHLELSIPATGTLLPAESVDLVSELSRRLVKVRAREGERVKKGDVLFELDAADLIAELSRLSVQEDIAKKTAERQANLAAERVGTQADSEVAAAQLEQAKASRRVLGVTLQKTQIRAPFDGVLGLRRVSEGAWLSPATVLVSIQDTSSLKLDFKVPERYAASVHAGATFRITVEGRGEPLTGTISATEPAVDVGSRSLTVRGVVQNPDSAEATEAAAKKGEKPAVQSLRPGTFAKVEMPVTVDDALLVPALVLQPSAEGRKVFVEKDGVVRAVPVEIGARGSEFVQVLSGVSAGDRVVTTNLLRLRDGARVRVVEGGK